MPRPHTATRKIREVLRLSLDAGLSLRKVAASAQVPFSTVSDYVRRAKAAGLTWPLPDDMDDDVLEARLFPSATGTAKASRPAPDWAKVHVELRRKSVTLMLLWLEYKQEHPDGWAYSQFTAHYRAWAKNVDLVMRQEHKAGERLFVDFPGETLPIYDPKTWQLAMKAELFVATMGCSSYVYAEAFPSQELMYWVTAHVHAFEAMGGCPELVVCDYVPRHIITVVCPGALCARWPPTVFPIEDQRPDVAVGGHITIREKRASRGGTRPSAKWAWCGIPPKYPEVRRPARRPPWSWY